jgi:hypothetical protein
MSGVLFYVGLRPAFPVASSPGSPEGSSSLSTARGEAICFTLLNFCRKFKVPSHCPESNLSFPSFCWNMAQDFFPSLVGRAFQGYYFCNLLF